MSRIGLLLVISLFYLPGNAQEMSKPVVGVADFTSEVDSKYARSVAEKVVEVVTNTHRFTVVDRTSYAKVEAELEFQKSEHFLNSKTVQQETSLAAEYIIVGHIVKMSVYAIKNTDGSTNGYKASTAFTLKVNEVESGRTTEAENFQTTVSPLMLSPESAVNEALRDLEPELADYFKRNFPLKTRISKIITTRKDAAATLLVEGAKSFGLNEGDELTVEFIDMVGGKPYPSAIGEIRVSRLAGEDFSECTVTSGGRDILARFNASEKLVCTLKAD